MDWGFTWLLDFVNGFWGVIEAVVVWAMDGIFYILMMVCCAVLEGLLGCVYVIVAAIDCSAMIANMASSYDLLPPALVYVINAICLPQGISIIVAGIMIRMALNLIPAALTRI